MKRSGFGPRDKPMHPGKGLSRGPGLERKDPMARSAPRQVSATPARKAPGRAPFPKTLAELLVVRSTGVDGVTRCDRCGRPLSGWWSRQHRRAHGMGGRAGAELHTAANVVIFCGSATSPGCHNAAENAERALCEVEGWVIRGEVIRPEEHPVLLHGVRWVLPAEDGWVDVPAPHPDCVSPPTPVGTKL